MSAAPNPGSGSATGHPRRWLALCGHGLRWSSDVSLRLMRWLLFLILAGYLVFGAAFLALRYLVLPNIDAYRPRIEQAASRALGVPVTIGDVDASWYGFRPLLELTDVRIHQADGTLALQVPRAAAVVSWWSLPALNLYLRSLSIDAPEVEVKRLADGRFVIAGFVLDPRAESEGGFAEWLFAQRQIAIRGARVHYVDAATAGEPQTIDFDEVDFLMRNRGFHHLFAARARPPAALAAPIDLRADFRHTPLLRRAGDWRAWRGELYANLDYADVGALARHVALPLELQQGKGAVRAWLELDHGQLARLTTDLALDDVALRFADDLPLLGLATVRGRVVARELAGKDAQGSLHGHEVALANFSFRTTDGYTLPATGIGERLMFHADGSVASGAFSAGALDLDALARLGAHLPFSAEHRRLLARMEPRGTVSALRYEWSGQVAAPERYNLDARFAGLALRPQPSERAPDPAHPLQLELGGPGFDNLSGRVEMNEKGGQAVIDAAQASVTFPGLFAQPEIRLDRLVAQADWQRTPAGIALRLSNTAFRNPDATGTISGTYASGGKGPGIVNLEGRLTQAEASAVHRYLPLTVPEDTRHWVERAIQGGGSSDVSFRLRGDLWDFPYQRPADGDFRIAARLKGVKLDFAPDLTAEHGGKPVWPLIEDIAGELVFERNGFALTNASAKSAGAALTRVNVRMADFSDARHLLEASGQVGGSLQTLLDYVHRAPVGAWLDGFLDDTRASGNARVALDLALPILRLADSKVRGELAFADNDVVLADGIPAFGRVNGKLQFNESGAGTTGLTANFLGGPVRIAGQPGAGQTLNLRAEGTASAAALRRYLELAALDRASGSARYAAQLAVHGGGYELAVDSDLAGIALDLPAPLAKSANASLPLRLRLKPAGEARAGGARREDIELALGNTMNLRAEREHSAGGTRVLRAAVGVGESAPLPADGLNVALKVRRFDLDAWRALADAQDAEAAPKGRTEGRAADAGWSGRGFPAHTVVTLQADELQAWGRRFERVSAGLERRDGNWQANVDARQAAGVIYWNEGSDSHPAGRVVARLARLDLEQTQGNDVTQLLDSAPAQEVPALDVVVEDFELRDKNFGRLELVADNVGSAAQRVWQLDRLVLASPDARLDATGTWGRAAGAGAAAPRRMQMKFTLDIANIGRFLDRMGVRDAMRGGTAKLEGEVSWQGSPLAIDYPSLAGKVTLAADHGQFLKSEPGVARLLGVLSLQSLARRMALDFRDVFSQGYAFDTVRADIDLAGGVASTRDFRMRGVAAAVVMEGSADLARETQNLRVVVLPDINAGAASVVYGLLANPVVGLGTFLAQLFLREPLMKALSYEYRVTGSWSDPHVEKLERTNGTSSTVPAQ